MPLDAISLRAVVEELRPQLLTLRIDKVQQPARDQVILLLRGNNEGVELRPLDPPAYRTIALAAGNVEAGPAARRFAEFAKAWVQENA